MRRLGDIFLSFLLTFCELGDKAERGEASGPELVRFWLIYSIFLVLLLLVIAGLYGLFHLIL